MTEKKYLLVLLGLAVVYGILYIMKITIAKDLFGLAVGVAAIYYSTQGTDLKKWQKNTILIVGIALIVSALIRLVNI